MSSFFFVWKSLTDSCYSFLSLFHISYASYIPISTLLACTLVEETKDDVPGGPPDISPFAFNSNLFPLFLHLFCTSKTNIYCLNSNPNKCNEAYTCNYGLMACDYISMFHPKKSKKKVNSNSDIPSSTTITPFHNALVHSLCRNSGCKQRCLGIAEWRSGQKKEFGQGCLRNNWSAPGRKPQRQCIAPKPPTG